MQPSRNIAARAGRWSARHRKTAVLGWIAFVVAGLHGRPEPRHEDPHARAVRAWATPGQRRQDRRRTPTPTGSTRRSSSRARPLKTERPAVPGRRSRRDHSACEETKGVTRSPVRTPRASSGAPISDDGHSTLISFEINGDPKDAAADEDRGRHASRDTKAAQQAHRRLQRRAVRRSGSSEEEFMKIFNERPAEGRPPLAADHADPAAARVRHAGGRRHPAPAGDHRRHGHDGPRRPRSASSRRSRRRSTT